MAEGKGCPTLYPWGFPWQLTQPGSFVPKPTPCSVMQHCKTKHSSHLTSYLIQSPNDGVDIFPTFTGVNLATSLWPLHPWATLPLLCHTELRAACSHRLLIKGAGMSHDVRAALATRLEAGAVPVVWVVGLSQWLTPAHPNSHCHGPMGLLSDLPLLPEKQLPHCLAEKKLTVRLQDELKG